jgi:hypothetical protein
MPLMNPSNHFNPFDDEDEDYVPPTRSLAVPERDRNMHEWIAFQLQYNILHGQAWVNNNLPNPDNIPAYMTVGEYEEMHPNN